MYDFILKFYNTNFYVGSLVIYKIKLNLLIPILILCDFIFLKTVYTQFYLNKPLFSFFINSSKSCYKKFYVTITY
jgi:hypothetical protein